MRKKLLLIAVGAIVIAINSCKRTDSVKTDAKGNLETTHGFGAVLNRNLYLKTPRANFDQIKSDLIAMGYSSKLKVNGGGTLPGSIILNRPPVGDQGATGTCVSWSTGYTLRGTLNNEFPNGVAVNPRSGWYIYQADHSSQNDCDAQDGMYVASGVYLLQTRGVPAANLDANLNSPCTAPTAIMNADAIKDKVTSYNAITTLTDIKTALSMHLPVEIGFHVFQSFVDAFNNGTTYTTIGTNDLKSAHAMCIVGYDDTRHAVLIQNQWGYFGGDSQYPGCVWFDYNLFTTNTLNIELYVATPPPLVSINGLGSFDWSAPGSGSGNITAPPGTTVAVTISAYGPSVTKTVFTLSGAQLTGPMGNNVTVSSGSTTQTFTMPASGSVTWTGNFSRTTSSGTGDIAVGVGTPPPIQTTPLINSAASVNLATVGTGNITAAAGTLVHVSVSANGVGTTSYFTMHDAPLTGNPSGVIYMQNNSTTQTFTMPSSGSVHWDGTFSKTGSTGTGTVAVY